jgi:hypothetical protein
VSEEHQQVRVLIIREGDYWVAQCLEYDIGAQARDFDELRDRVAATVQAELEETVRRHGRAFYGIDPSPQYFHDLWDRRAKRFGPSVSTTVKNVDIEFALAA